TFLFTIIPPLSSSTLFPYTTLFRSFPDSLAGTLQKVHDKGIKIIIATGRSLPMIHQKVPKIVPVDGYVGASGMTVHRGDTLLSRTDFSEEKVAIVMTLVRDHRI